MYLVGVKLLVCERILPCTSWGMDCRPSIFLFSANFAAAALSAASSTWRVSTTTLYFPGIAPSPGSWVVNV